MIDREMVDRMKASRFAGLKAFEDRAQLDTVLRSEHVDGPVTGWDLQKLKAEAVVHVCLHMKADTDQPSWIRYGKDRLGRPRRKCPKCGLVQVVPK